MSIRVARLGKIVHFPSGNADIAYTASGSAISAWAMSDCLRVATRASIHGPSMPTPIFAEKNPRYALPSDASKSPFDERIRGCTPRVASAQASNAQSPGYAEERPHRLGARVTRIPFA